MKFKEAFYKDLEEIETLCSELDDKQKESSWGLLNIMSSLAKMVIKHKCPDALAYRLGKIVQDIDNATIRHTNNQHIKKN